MKFCPLIMSALLFTHAASGKPARTLESFESGGKKIRVETFADTAKGDVPSLIVLHGATGVEFANRFIAGIAENFAAQGFTVHLVHYFDRTGEHYADDATIKRSSNAWIQTVDDAVKFIRGKHPRALIGIFGYSLGGYLAAAETVSHKDVRAAVILSGGLDENSARAIRNPAPMLILHGEADSRVPVKEARQLESALKGAGAAPDLHIYPGEGHVFTLATYADVVRRGAEFFHRHLRRSAP